jgi:hypothetical protein
MVKGENFMKKHYEFVKDQNELFNFFTNLHNLEKDEVYTIVLATRKKYVTPEMGELKLHDNVLKHMVIRDSNNFGKFFQKLLQFDVPIGSYYDDNGNSIPEEALVLYMIVNPRSTMKAMKGLMDTFNTYFLEIGLTPDKEYREELYEKVKKIERTLLSEVQSANGRKLFVDVDIDCGTSNKSEGLVLKIKEYFKDYNYILVETRGGYHLLIDNSFEKELGKTFYPTIQKLNHELQVEFGEKAECIINKQSMIPLPGTSQGGFMVKILE